MGGSGLEKKQYEILVEVRHKEKIADPEGNTIKKALSALGFESVSKVSFGKAIRLQITATNTTDALEQAEKMAQRLLANPVMENYHISLAESSSNG